MPEIPTWTLQTSSKATQPSPSGIVIRHNRLLDQTLHAGDALSAITNSTSCGGRSSFRPQSLNTELQRTALYAEMVDKIKKLNEAQIDEQLRDIATKAKVAHYTRNTLFHEKKFINSQKELESLASADDLGYEVMRNMTPKIPFVEQRSWWLLYQNVVKIELERARGNCFSNHIRPDFISK